MLTRLFNTQDDKVLAILRLVLGIVFFAHGAQKVLGWFGGYGFSGTMNAFTHQMGIPYVFALLAIAAEFLGGLGLILGLLGRIAALGIGVEMIVAAAMVHLPNGLFMNWYGNQKGEGIEYHLLVVAMALMLLVKGAGAFSLDRVIAQYLSSAPGSAAGSLTGHTLSHV